MSQYAMTVEEALALLAEVEHIKDRGERHREYRRILERVRALGYHDGGEDERWEG